MDWEFDAGEYPEAVSLTTGGDSFANDAAGPQASELGSIAPPEASAADAGSSWTGALPSTPGACPELEAKLSAA